MSQKENSSNRIYIVAGKTVFGKDNYNITIYGAFSSFEAASAVGFHYHARDNLSNPFMKGNMLMRPELKARWGSNFDGFLRHIKPKIISLELDDYSTLTRINLGSAAIEGLMREPWEPTA